MNGEKTSLFPIFSDKIKIENIGQIDKGLLNKWFLKISKLDETLDIESMANSFIDEVLGGECKVIPFNVYVLLKKLINFFGYRIGNNLYEELRYREMIVFE